MAQHEQMNEHEHSHDSSQPTEGLHLPRRSERRPYEPEWHPLSDDEIENFFKDIDKDNNGFVTFDELEAKLEEVHEEIAPNPKTHNLHHPERRFMPRKKKTDVEKDAAAGDPEHDGLTAFLHSLLPGCKDKLSKEEFISHVKTWDIPSQKQTSREDEDAKDAENERRMSLRRKLRARWSVSGPKVLFITFVVALTLGMSLWQGLIYVYNPQARAALGWGVIVAKFSAGALYPILFFMVLSMSRHFATWCRRSYYISKFVNWDRSQSFHIWMACAGLFFATLHAIGHLTGTFLYGSRPAQQEPLAVILGPEQVPKSYASFASSRPGWSGITALAVYYIIAGLSAPKIRQWSYEAFQLSHLLMFPMFAMLCLHGTARLLQYPMLGFWLAFPIALTVYERVQRLILGFHPIPARMEILDDDTVVITCKNPTGKPWNDSAGQYVLLQVPSIAFFQWHPFTISACRGDILQLHIKTDGDWTGALRRLSTEEDIRVGIDGPFGAPAQRFYDFDRSLIIGAGVGITPFSAILTDLEEHLTDRKDPWQQSGRRGSRASSISSASTDAPAGDESDGVMSATTEATAIAPAQSRSSSRGRRSSAAEDTKAARETRPERRVDFHWMVRDKNYLLWFSSLLNRAHDLSQSLPKSKLDLRLTTHITQKRKNISTHVFRYLLDAYRTPSAPYSALTGLKMRSHFGRPDMEGILEDFHEDMLRQGWTDGKVGVFYCGAPVVGRILADTCAELTAKSRADGSKIRYVFMMEVFG